MWFLAFVAILCGSEPATAAVSPAVTLQTMDGRNVAGTLIALDGSQLQLRHADQDERFTIAQLLSVSPTELPAGPRSSLPASHLVVRLVDDSQLGAIDAISTQAGLQLSLGLDRQAEVPISAVAWVRFPSSSADINADWEGILELEAAADMLVVRKEDSLDYHEGIVRSVKSDVVEFELDGEVLPIKRTKIEGIRYFHRTPREMPDAVCRIICPGGERLNAADLSFQGAEVAITTPAGLKIALPWKTIERLDFSQGKIVYLSDLEWDPQLYERQAYFGGKQPIDQGLDLYAPQRDRALDGGLLKLARHDYAKGLAIHSRTRLVYRLPAAYRRFLALAGIDDRTGSRGAVRLVIEGDGRELYAGNLAGSEPPLPLDLDIVGVKRLSLLVDFGEDLDISDHLDLAEARIVK